MSPPAPPGLRPRLLLVDDHQMVAESFSARLAPNHEIVGVACDGDGLLALLAGCRADCLLLDIEMPRRNGLELLPEVRKLAPNLPVIIVSMLADRVMADAAMKGGARGFVPKEAPLAELELAIREVMAGRDYISPRIPRSSFCVSLNATHPGLHRLTPRQQQIMLLLGEGKSGKEISDLLNLSPSTITFHRHNMMRILGLETEGALTRYSVLIAAGRDDAAPRPPRPTRARRPS